MFIGPIDYLAAQYISELKFLMPVPRDIPVKLPALAGPVYAVVQQFILVYNLFFSSYIPIPIFSSFH